MELLHHWFLRALFLGLFIVHIGAEIEFREEPYDKVVAQGQPVYFDCMAADTQNRGTISVQWKHNSTPLSAGGRVTIFPNGTLQLVSTQTGDEGTYSCTASLVVSGGLLEQRESLAAMLYFAFLNPVDLITGNQTVIDKQLAPAYFQCVSGESRPLPTITWERNGIPVTDELSYGEQFGGTGSLKWSQTLQINNVRKRHEGSYRCVVSNPLLNGQVQRSSYSFLEVLPNPGDPYISIAPQNQIIPAGEPAIFSCQILGDPAPSISWRKLDDPDDLIDTPERYARNDGSLYFADVADMYEGNYVCTGTSRLGQVSTNPVALISARMDWVFTQNPSDTEVVEDDRATLSCRPPFSKPQANITWYKDNAVFQWHQGVPFLPLESVGDVYFSSITKDDEGSYFCVATNDFLPQSVTSDTAVLSVRVKASIEVPPVAREVILGNDLTLTCEARGDPTPMIVWRKDSAIIQAGGRTTIGNAGQLLHILGIIGLDQGTYTCEVSNAYGSDSASVYVNVLVSPQITTGPGDLRVGLGSSILLPCIVIGDPVPDVTWYKDNTLLTFDPSDIHYQLTNQGLTINEARVSDGGSFRCQATNKAGTSESSGTLIIETPPVITTLLTNQTVYQEAVVVFVCQASGEPRPDLVWFFNDGPVPSWGSISNQGQILTVSSASVLTIGKVTCRAQNRQGQAESEANLQVRVAPDISPISDSTVDAGTSFTVHCITSAFPEPTITWLKGQDVIIASERIIFSSPGSLTIASVTKEDQGDYSCVASNGVGNTRENFRISVLGLPGAPTILNAAPVTGDSITVYWSVGGDVMDTTHYQLQYKLSLMTSWTTFLDSIEATISPQSSTVYGLDESRSYQFRIYAKNSLGISSPSNIVVASTPSVTGPSAPRNFKILSFNATAVTLQWEIPVTKNGPIEVYTVEYRKTGTNDYSSVQVLGNDQYTIEAIVVGLSPISSYQFRVTAATLHNGQHQFGDFTDYIEQMTSPSAPTASPSNVVITASSSTTILVSWSTVAPEHQNGPIQGYNVSYKETGSSITPWVETVDKTVFSVRLTGLMKWTEYDVQMWAFNGEGAGPKTDVIIRRTKADAPTASPLNIGLIATNKTAILVTWQALPEADRFGPIDGYLVTYWSQNSMSRQTLDVPGTDNFLVLTGLEVATLYFAQMVAYNLVDGVRLEGPPSVETSASTQEGIPGHVRSITASEVGSDYIYLSWEPPSNSNGVILAYVITYTADFPQEVTTDVLSVVTGGVRDSSRRRRDVIFGNETYGQIETTETFYNLTSLKPETDYVIEIRGRTSAGMGVNAEKLFISTGRALPTRLPPPGQGTTQPPMDSQPPPLTETMNPFPGEAAYPLNSLIIFISAVSLAGAALCLALVVLLVWCKRRGDDKTLKNSNYLIDNDQMCSSSQRSGSDDIVLDISRANSKSPSTVSSRNTSRLPSVSTPTPSPPEEFADLSGMNDGPMDPNRPRASSSPSMDHMRVHRDMDGYAAYGGQVEQGSGTVPRANGRLYTPARSPRNAKYHPASHGQLESQDTTPDKLDELYNKVARTSRGPSRLKQDSLAAIAVLLDQEETNGDLQPVENPSSIVISNERTTL